MRLMKRLTTWLLMATLLACTEAPAPVADAAKAEMTKAEKNKMMVATIYENFEKLDPSAAFALMSNDIVDYGDGSMAPVKGIDSVKAGLNSWLSNMESMHIGDLKIVAEGNDVWASGVFSGTYKEDMWGMPLKGKSFKIFDVDIFTLNDEGKITSHRSVQGPEVWFAQMGIPMPKK